MPMIQLKINLKDSIMINLESNNITPQLLQVLDKGFNNHKVAHLQIKAKVNNKEEVPQIISKITIKTKRHKKISINTIPNMIRIKRKQVTTLKAIDGLVAFMRMTLLILSINNNKDNSNINNTNNNINRINHSNRISHNKRTQSTIAIIINLKLKHHMKILRASNPRLRILKVLSIQVVNMIKEILHLTNKAIDLQRLKMSTLDSNMQIIKKKIWMLDLRAKASINQKEIIKIAISILSRIIDLMSNLSLRFIRNMNPIKNPCFISLIEVIIKEICIKE